MHFHLHSARDEVRDTPDVSSALAYYLVDAGVIKTSPQFSKKERLETWPAWSGDGRYLYFCSAETWWSGWDVQNFTSPSEKYDQIKYDLVRISYDLDNDKWGELETVLSAQDTGLSIAGDYKQIRLSGYSCPDIFSDDTTDSEVDPSYLVHNNGFVL